MKAKVKLSNSIMVKNQPAAADSKMLENFIAPFTATVVERLEKAGVEITGCFRGDEFGASGIFSDLDFYDKNPNPVCVELIKSLKTGQTDLALCNDYTGAVARAVAAVGLYYIHPTYGTVSRYGLIQCVSSMDQIGIICKSPEVGFDTLRIIAGFDPKDGIMAEAGENQPQEENPGAGDGSLKSTQGLISEIKQILCCAELSNNISRYDGIKFGYRAKEYNGLTELYKKSRTEAFGLDVKLAVIIGAMVLYEEDGKRIYEKAMKIRGQIRDSFLSYEEKIIKIEDPAISRLCGFPALSTTEGTYMAKPGMEKLLESFWKENGSKTPYIKGGTL